VTGGLPLGAAADGERHDRRLDRDAALALQRESVGLGGQATGFRLGRPRRGAARI
jgi:hypothetical protein